MDNIRIIAVLKKILLVACLAILSTSPVRTQPQNFVYTDIGINNVSDGWFLRAGDILSYIDGDNTFQVGMRLDVINNRDVFFSGVRMMYARDLAIRSLPLELSGFFLFSPVSDILRETNAGLSATHTTDHFRFSLGTHFRTYAYTAKGIDRYGMDGNTRLRENWNLIYHISYAIKPPDNRWNIRAAVTNADHFLIYQETNPMLNITGNYTYNNNLEFVLDAWYQQAGLFNINVHYFGFVIRPGIVWHI